MLWIGALPGSSTGELGAVGRAGAVLGRLRLPVRREVETGGGAFVTPLRYPGGKGHLGPWIAHVVRHNRISGGWYAEPYAGGSGSALFLLTQGYVDHIVINDIDPVVYSFWKAATGRSAGLNAKTRNTPVTRWPLGSDSERSSRLFRNHRAQHTSESFGGL